MAIINSLPATSDRPEPIMHLDHLPAGTPLLKTLTLDVATEVFMAGRGGRARRQTKCRI